MHYLVWMKDIDVGLDSGILDQSVTPCILSMNTLKAKNKKKKKTQTHKQTNKQKPHTHTGISSEASGGSLA